MSIQYQPLYDTANQLQFNCNNKINHDISIEIEIEYSHIIDGIITNGVWYKTKSCVLDREISVISLEFPHQIKFTRTAKVHLRMGDQHLIYVYYYPFIHQSKENSIDMFAGRDNPVVKFNRKCASGLFDYSSKCIIC